MEHRLSRGKLAFVALVFGALALWPLVSSSFGIDLVTKIMVYAIFALSLELLVGMTGLVCLGHAGFFGIGAYAAVLLSPEGSAASLAFCCLTSRAVTATPSMALAA